MGKKKQVVLEECGSLEQATRRLSLCVCVQVSVLENCQESQESCGKLRSWQPLVREDGP